jgi:hypothetical protein
VRKVGSCGEVVFVDEAAESVAALDAALGRVHYAKHPGALGWWRKLQ